MPIVHTNSNKVFEEFETHMEEMVRSVLPLPGGVLLKLIRKKDAGVLQFVRGGIGTSVPVATDVGQLHLSLNQDLVALREGPRKLLQYRLRTNRYQYKLLPTDDPEAEALLRWEYNATTPPDGECRNHLHLNASIPAGHGTFYLSRLHVPTAYVLVEHVLRFLFHDLGVAARTGDWPAILRASETTFYEKFSGKRYRFR